MVLSKRHLRNLAKSLFTRFSRAGQRVGFDLLPRHFYSSIPDYRELAATRYWRAPRSMVGVAGADVDSQLAFVEECCTPALRDRLKSLDLVAHGVRENQEVGYGPTEADFLYCFISTKKPKRIVQVGAGFSTAVILLAAADAGHPVQVSCVDPFPTEYLRKNHAAGRIKLIAEKAQEVDIAEFTGLDAGDLLFIDSTHTVKVGSEVNRLIQEVLPRMANGCYVHFHDIFFPYDYPRAVFQEIFLPLETTLLHAYLIHNSRYTVRASLSMLHYARTPQLKMLLPNYRPAAGNDGVMVPDSDGHFPSAIYLQVTG